MAQHDLNIANQSFPSFRTDLNNALSAIQTTHSGTSLPTGAVAGQIWLDTTSATVPILKYYDGVDNITLATINHTANTVDFADSSVVVTGLSSTATGTVLTLTDTVSTSTVNLIIDNQKEVRFRETTANGTNFVALKAPASLASDLTFTLPSAHGTANQALVTNGSGGVLSFATISGGIEWQSVHSSSTLTAVAGYGYFLNTTSNAITVTLPASPSAGNQIALVDYAGTFDTNALTINPNGNKIEGGTSSLQLSGEREGVLLVYADSTQGWLATSGINEGTDALSPVSYSIDFLVIAGGASGGVRNGGGGGAGGFRTSTQTATGGTVITVTVGDGGSAIVSDPESRGNDGSDSSISGSGLTTITSAGGGGGASGSTSNSSIIVGKNGGSAGGGSRRNDSDVAGNGGSGNTPSTSPSQGNNGGNGLAPPSNGGGGGGGGAGAVGAISGSSGAGGGAGGNGTASSITGSSVTRAGGGGGGGHQANNNVQSSGGTGGGGGSGLHPSTNGTSGTANTGGGGGGTNNAVTTSGAGGKGVVILSMPSANFSGTTTGSPTESTSGANKILVFNGSGSYTA